MEKGGQPMKILRLSAAIAVVVCLILAASAPALALKEKPPKVKEKPTKVVPQAPPGQAKKTPKPEHIPKPKQTPKPESIPQPGEEPTTKVEVCHKPGTPAQKTMWLPESAVPGHLAHGDVLGPCSKWTPTLTVTPTLTITPTAAPTMTMVLICHKPGTPAEKTLWLPEPAIAGHLGHGDVLGACEDVVSTLVEVCHKPGTPAEKTLWLPEPAIAGHLGHGDVLGACEDLTPTPTVTPTVTVTPTLVIICHKPGTPAEQTLELPESAIAGHLGHGDVLGACGEEAPAEDGTPQGAEPTPWTTRLVTVGLSLFLILRGFVASLPL
jgi:hypothetical protein